MASIEEKNSGNSENETSNGESISIENYAGMA